MLNSIYDEQFSNLPDLTWLPWVGKHYAANDTENKILLVGESHYLGEKPDEEQKYKNPDMTRMIVKDMGVDGHKWGSDFFANTYKLMLPDRHNDQLGRRKLWDNVAFYNFIQTPMASQKHRPTSEHSELAKRNFLNLLNILKPSVCIFLGLKAEAGLNQTLAASDYQIIKSIGWKDNIKRSYGRYGRIESSEGQTIRLIFVRHPSSYFNANAWNAFLQKYIGEQLNWLSATES